MSANYKISVKDRNATVEITVKSMLEMNTLVNNNVAKDRDVYVTRTWQPATVKNSYQAQSIIEVELFQLVN